MAGHIQDRWYRTEPGPDGKPVKVKTDRHGTGMRYRARYVGPDGTEKSKSFPDRHRRDAESWLAQVKTDMERGQYVDPKAARTTFQQYAERWLASQTTDVATREGTERRLRLHTFPHLGSRPLGTFQPAHLREWLRTLEETGLASSYVGIIFANVRTVLSAAVDDGLLVRNPCTSRSVRQPATPRGRIVPWSAERVFAVREGLSEPFRAMADLGGGCGLRQGEIFGLAADDVSFDAETLHVVQQVKITQGGLVFAPPKRNKLRDVPLPGAVAALLTAHMAAHPPLEVTLPWRVPTGEPVTKRLIFTNQAGHALRRQDFNEYVWKPALAAAGVIPVPGRGKRYAAAPQDGMHALRHFYASVLLDAGESIRAVSEYLGHADPGFTLRIYTHLMPSSSERARKAVDALYEGPVTL